MVNILGGITNSISTLDFSQHQFKFQQRRVEMHVGLKILTNRTKSLLSSLCLHSCGYKRYPISTVTQFTPAFVIDHTKIIKQDKELSAGPGLNSIMDPYGVLN